MNYMKQDYYINNIFSKFIEINGEDRTDFLQGLITNDINKSVKAFKEGQIEIKNDKDGNVATSIGKKSFNDKKIMENFNALIQTVQKAKPNVIKEDFILSSFITSTMGVSHKIKVKF